MTTQEQNLHAGGKWETINQKGNKKEKQFSGRI